MRLATYRKIMPGYWEERFFYDHPSGYARVHGSMLWLQENQDIAGAAAAVTEAKTEDRRTVATVPEDGGRAAVASAQVGARR